jgi:hypothetical protein
MTTLHEDEARPAADPLSMEAPALSSADVAQYVERMCAELTILADRSGLGFLAYLLEVAREEARLHAPRSADTVTMHGELPPPNR